MPPGSPPARGPLSAGRRLEMRSFDRHLPTCPSDVGDVLMRKLFTFTLLAVCSLAMAPIAEAADLCPNATVRAQQDAAHLSDCRAYEMVSPTDKAGYDVRRATGTIRSSADGDAVTYNTFGPFAGT